MAGRYYQKYFEEYEIREVPKKNGKGTKKEYVYKGIYYRQSFSVPARYMIKIFYLAVYVAELSLFFGAAVRENVSNTVPAVIVGQGLIMLALIWQTWVMFFYLTAPGDMTIYKYKSTSLQLKKALPVCMGAYGFTAVAALVSVIWYGNGDIFGQLICPAMYAGEIVLCAVLYMTERNIVYLKIPNREKGNRERNHI